MKIKAYSELNNSIISEIRRVEEICNREDNLKTNTFLDNSINFNKEINTLFLAYEEDKLVAFLKIFIPTCKEGEISACTLPEYRNKGYFKALFSEALKELKKYNVEDVLLVLEDKAEEAKAVAVHLGAKYDFSEYLLKFNGDIIPELDLHKHISILEAREEHLEAMARIIEQSFNDSYEEAKDRIKKAFQTESRSQFVIKLEDRVIGKAGVSFEEGNAYIFGVALSPEYRGRGYSKILLRHIVKEVYLNHTKNISLEVNSSNKVAFNLYTKNGFIVDNAFHYYRKPCK